MNALRTIAPELPFEIIYREIQGPEETFEMEGYRIRAFRVNHNVLCYGYTVEIDRAGKFDAERAKAQGIPLKLWNPLQKGETMELDGRIYTPDLVLGPPERESRSPTAPTPGRPNRLWKMPEIQTFLSVRACMENRIKQRRRWSISI